MGDPHIQPIHNVRRGSPVGDRSPQLLSSARVLPSGLGKQELPLRHHRGLCVAAWGTLGLGVGCSAWAKQFQRELHRRLLVTCGHSLGIEQRVQADAID